MTVSDTQKNNIKNQIRDKLCGEKEVRKVILFGSFINSRTPNDIDIAIFQDSNEKYLPLSLKYRKLMREISKILPIDIIPLKFNHSHGAFLDEIESGEIIYER